MIAKTINRLHTRLEPWATRSNLHRAVYDFLCFGIKQGWACLFGGIMLGLLITTHLFYPPSAALARYDFLVIAAVAVQAALLLLRMESWEEAKVILIYHVVGTIMEIFKTSHGSWEYPEAGVLKIAGVPLFSGFMYACIGSYIARAWRLFDFRFTHYPPLWATAVLACLSYLNFFTHHYGPDLRIALFAFSAVLYGRTWIYFTPATTTRRMPLIVGFVLVALFIWFAENCGTLTSTWRYPSQRLGWELVPIAKLGSWYLLMILSFVLVTLVHRSKLVIAGRSSNVRKQ